MKIDTYKCDICGKEFHRTPSFSDHTFALSLRLPSRPEFAIHFRTISGSLDVDICNHCLAQEFLKDLKDED